MKHKFLIILLITFMNYSFSWSSNNNMQNNDCPLIDKLSFAQLDKEQTNKFLNWIRNLYYNNSVGEKLIDNIAKSLEIKGIHVEVTLGPSTSFVHTGTKIEVNFSQLEKPQTPCLGRKRTLAPLDNTANALEVYEIGVCPDLPENIIGHELIHMLHFLENPDEFFLFMKEDPSKQFWINNKDPEIERRLWRTTEEKRTVLGDPRANIEISELGIRASWKDPSMNLPPRYAYQASDQCFYEIDSVIEEILTNHWSDLWSEKLELLYKGLGFLPFQFDKEKAQTSALNRFKNESYFSAQEGKKVQTIEISQPQPKPNMPNTELIKQICDFHTEPLEKKLSCRCKKVSWGTRIF